MDRVIYISCLLLALGFVPLTACGDDADEGANQASNQNQQDPSGNHNANGGDNSNASHTDNTSPNNTNSNTNSNNNNTNSNSNSNNTNSNNNTSNGANTEEEGATFCRDTCQEPADCGTEAGWICEDERCAWDAEQTSQCDGDAECVALYSGWADPCTNADDCAITQACIDHEGQGLCAFEHGEYIDCNDLDQELVSMDRYGDSGQAMICANLDAICHPEMHYCIEACQTDSDCVAAGVDTCVEGLCQCGSDQACDDVSYGDVCYDGSCGCSSDAICIDAGYDVCE